MAEIIEKTGKSYNIFDKVNNVWNKISFWHKASDCEFNDGKTAQTKVGAIDGITSDLSGESETVAASIKCVNQLNSSLTADNAQAFRFAYDSTTQKYGYKVKEADTDVFVPFNSTVLEYIPISGLTNGTRVSTNGLPHFVAMCFGTSLTSLSQYLLYSDGIYCQELSVSRGNSTSLSDIDETGFTFKTKNSGTFTGHLFVLY